MIGLAPNPDITQLADDTRPWFAWVHLFDPHAPYRAPAAFARGRSPYDAEVAWTETAMRRLDTFLPRLATHLERLRILDVNFRPLDPAKPVTSPPRR